MVLSSTTFPSKSHVLSIKRDEVTLFQVRAIRYDLRIFGLRSLDTSFVRPLCALGGAGRARPASARPTYIAARYTAHDNKMNAAIVPLLYINGAAPTFAWPTIAAGFKYKIKNLISVAKPINVK